MQEPAARSKNRIIEELRQFSAVNNARALVTMGELAKCRGTRPSALPDFDKDTYPHACVIAGDEVLTRRREVRGVEKLFVDTSQVPAANGDHR